jgi:hypothetical protein
MVRGAAVDRRLAVCADAVRVAVDRVSAQAGLQDGAGPCTQRRLRSVDDIVNGGTHGAFVAHCHELRLAYQFEAGHSRHAAIARIRACNLSWLKQFRNKLLTDGITVV